MARARRTSWNIQKVAAVLAVLLALAGLIVTVTVPELRCALHLEQCSVDARAKPMPIEIDRVNGQVPRCATLGGRGDVPVDKHLWLAILTTGSEQYFFRPVAVNFVQHNWIARNVTIGAPNTAPRTFFTVYAVLVDNATDQRLKNGDFAGGRPLPPKFEKIDQIEVERSSDNADCK